MLAMLKLISKFQKLLHPLFGTLGTNKNVLQSYLKEI